MDTILENRVDEYFDLDLSKEDKFERELKIVLDYIRKKNFSKISSQLGQIRKKIDEDKIDSKDLQSFEKEIKLILQAAVLKHENFLREFILELSESNMNKFQLKINDKIKEIKKSHARQEKMKPSERSYEVASRLIDFLEKRSGSIEGKQKKMILDFYSKYHFPQKSRLDNIRQRADQFILAHKLKGQFLEQYSRSAFSDTWIYPSIQYKKDRDQYMSRFYSLLIELFKSLNEKQKKKLGQNLKQWSLDLRDLAQQK